MTVKIIFLFQKYNRNFLNFHRHHKNSFKKEQETTRKQKPVIGEVLAPIVAKFSKNKENEETNTALL